jgi:hypothetical protein
MEIAYQGAEAMTRPAVAAFKAKVAIAAKFAAPFKNAEPPLVEF